MVHKERKAQEGHKVPQDLPVQLVQQVLKDIQVLRVR